MFDFSALTSKVCVVTFIKKNGEKRVMKCTKSMTFVPEAHHPFFNRTSKKPVGLHSVFDLEKQGWRSFYESSVLSFEVL